VEMLAVQLPGRGMRKSEPFFKTAQEAAAAVVPMVAPFVLDTPYCVVGHSLGTWLSFELLSCLRVRPNPRTAWWGTRSARGSASSCSAACAYVPTLVLRGGALARHVAQQPSPLESRRIESRNQGSSKSGSRSVCGVGR
jgi:hypothetical protein